MVHPVYGMVVIHSGENSVDGIPVVVTRKRIRRINLRVTADGVVRLSVPASWATLRDGEAFLRAKLDWVRETREKMLSRPAPAHEEVGEAELASLRCLLAGLTSTWCVRLGEEPVA